NQGRQLGFLGPRKNRLWSQFLLPQILTTTDIVKVQDRARRILIQDEETAVHYPLAMLELTGEVRHVQSGTIPAAQGPPRSHSLSVPNIVELNFLVVAKTLCGR